MNSPLSALVSHRPPPKLARFELSSVCDLHCKFCCWEETALITPSRRLTSVQTSFLCNALCQSGCYNYNITGGEPLLLPLDYLGQTIQSLNSVPNVRQLWITTNGQRLVDERVPRALHNAGLKSLAISIAAHTDSTYSDYTGGKMDLTTLLKGMRSASQQGIDCRVHVPLNGVGVSSADDVLELVEKVRQVGVRELSYFALNRGPGAVAENFPTLYRDPQQVTEALLGKPGWKLHAEPNQRPFFGDGEFKICFPRSSTVTLMTDNCRSRDCGAYCQGVYAVYVVFTRDGWAFRACHRRFEDENNVYHVKDEWLTGENYNELSRLLKDVWGYAYGHGS